MNHQLEGPWLVHSDESLISGTLFRRNLRGEIEKQNLAVNKEFFESLKSLKEQVDSLCEDIGVMSNCCEDIISQLNSTKEKTHGNSILFSADE